MYHTSEILQQLRRLQNKRKDNAQGLAASKLFLTTMVTTITFYAITVILMLLGYMAYGWKGSFWVAVVMFIPLMMITSAVLYFTKHKLDKIAKKNPKALDEIIEEVLERQDD